MLDKFRDLSKTWVAKALLVFITIPFALFGIEYYFRQSGGSDAVASVDGYMVSQAQFSESLRNQLDRARSGATPGSALDTAALDSPEMRYEALNALINRYLLTHYADQHHLVVPDATLVKEIGQIQAFQEKGSFSQKRYEQILAAQGMTPAVFESRLRDDLKIQLQQETLSGTQWTPQVSVDAYLKLNNQQREISVALIEASNYLNQVKVTDEQVKAFYDKNIAFFQNPERVKLQYLVYSANDLMQHVNVTADMVRKAYEDPANQARWKGTETRRASHILLAVAPNADAAQRKAAQDRALQLLQQLKAHPEQFAALAKANSQDPGSAPLGGDLGYFGHGAMTPPFDAAVFAMQQGEIKGPVETSFGYHLILVTDIRPGKTLTLAEATPQLTEELRKQLAAQRFAEGAENFSNLVYEQSNSLEPAAKSLQLTLASTDWLVRGTPSGNPLLDQPKFRQAVFTPEVLTQGRNTTAVEVQPNVLVAARVVAHEAASTRSLADVAGAIKQQLQQQEAAHLAAAAGSAALAALKAGKPVEQPHLVWSAPHLVTRQQAGAAGVPAEAVKPAFALAPAALPLYAAASLANGNEALIRVSQITAGATDDPRARSQTETGLSQAYGDEVMSAYMAGIRQGAEVKLLNKAALEVKK